MKKLITLVLLLCACVMGVNAQVLYKISGKDLQKPSYVLGTYHFAKMSFVDSIPGLKDAMANTEQVYGELDMNEMMSPENMQKMQAALMLEDGKELKDVLTAEQMGKLNAFLRSFMGVDMTNPMVGQQFGKFSPQGLTTTLTALMYLKNHPGEFDPQNQFDTYFQTQALQSGKSVGGFETVDFQINVMLKGTSMERAIQTLMCFVENEDLQIESTNEIVMAYYSQDLKAIEAAMDEKLNNECDPTPEEEAAMIDNRNADWLTKIPAVIKDKSTLIVVGAAHLPGEKGVLDGLKKLGYKVEGVR